jgi:hypothetical protein
LVLGRRRAAATELNLEPTVVFGHERIVSPVPGSAHRQSPRRGTDREPLSQLHSDTPEAANATDDKVGAIAWEVLGDVA